VDKIPDWRTLLIMALLGGGGIGTFGFALPQNNDLEAYQIVMKHTQDTITNMQVKIISLENSLTECKNESE
jgi:hypothetical protein